MDLEQLKKDVKTDVFIDPDKYDLTNGEILCKLGLYYEDMGIVKKAIEFYDKAIGVGYTVALFHMGQLYENINKLSSAIDYYKKSIDANASNKNQSIFNLADIYYEEYHDYDKALFYYSMVMMAHYRIAYCYFYKRNFPKAIEHFMSHTQNTELSTYYLGQCYKELNDYNGAIYYYKLSIDYGYIPSIVKLALIYEQLYDDVNTILCYQLGIEKGCRQCLFLLGFYYEKRHRNYEKSMEYFIISVNTGFDVAIDHLIYNIQHKKGVRFIYNSLPLIKLNTVRNTLLRHMRRNKIQLI